MIRFSITPHSKQYNRKYIVYRISSHQSNQILSNMNQQRPVEYTSIDFDDAHNHWIQNKRKLSNGMYRYICIGFFKNGNQCNRNPLVGKNTCKIHDINPSKHEETKIERNIDIPKKTKPQPKNIDNALSFEDKSSLDNPRTPTFVPHYGVLAKPNTTDSVESNEIEIKQRLRSSNLQKYSIHIADFVRSFWKTYRTLPVEEIMETPKESNGRQDPIIDPYKETIRIQFEPLKYVKFEELRKAFDTYGSIDKVRNPDTIRKNKYNILNVAYYLQMMLIFLEGLNEQSTKHVCVMMMKTRILMFVNYDTNTYLQTTESKWREISHNIRDEILYVLDDIFDEIGE